MDLQPPTLTAGPGSATASRETLRPASVIDHRYTLASIVVAIGLFCGFRLYVYRDEVTVLIAVLLAIGVTNLAGELKSWPRIAPRAEAPLERISRVATKLYALAALYGAVALSYFLFAGFTKDFVTPLASIAWKLLLPAAVLSPLYVWITDAVQEQPEDELYDLGRIITGQTFDVAWGPALSYLRGWLVKAYFAPLMIGSALNSTKGVLNPDFFASLEPLNIFQSTYRLAGWASILFGALGYLCTFKLIRTHIKSAEPTLFGWLICVICYDPFWPLISKQFLNYEEGYYWGHFFGNTPVMWAIWGTLIVMAESAHAWVTVSFGLRFSNLTNRGIITNGPYRWLKHPSYTAKLVSYWLISIPFISNQGIDVAVRNTLLLILLTLIYVGRAWTEERHLSADPDYVAYSRWMEENGLWGRAKRFVLGAGR